MNKLNNYAKEKKEKEMSVTCHGIDLFSA